MIPGVQISSLKPLLTGSRQVEDAFRQVRAMGCAAVQLQWIDPSVPADAIAQALKNADLISVSVQDLYESVRANTEYYIDLNARTGGTWLCVSRIPERLRTLSGLDRYTEELRALQEALNPCSQELCFHPVGADFEPIEGVCPVEYLLSRMPELPLCLDLYHLNKRGFCLPEWIGKYAARICMVHFKDEKAGRLVPAGQGDTDWTGVVPACLKADIPYAFVEQEKWDRDPFDCLREALDWLKSQL